MVYNKGFWSADSLPVFHSLEKTGGQKMAEQKIDWMKEANALKERGEGFWKPKPGQHTIVFLSDGLFKESEFEGKMIPKVQFEISIDKATYLWDVTRGQTRGSLYGQIALIAKAHGGKVSGEKITLIVKGTKKETQYTVLEALSLMQEVKGAL